MRILLTGGAGFIGSHLASQLLQLGHRVDCLDNLSTGSRANVTNLIPNEKFQLIIGDASNPTLVKPLVEQADCIFHLAASVGVQTIVKSPIESIENNLVATSLILSCASLAKKRTFIFSTSEVYGKSDKFPFVEDDDLVLGPPSKSRWSYAAAKLVDDFLAISYHQERNLPVTVVRLFNTIGLRQVGHYGMVVPRFLEQARSHRPITIYGHGHQSRCFTDVRDVTEILIRLISIEASHGQVINVGSNEEVTILELAEKIRKLTDSHSELTFVPFAEAFGPNFEDMDRRVPCQQKLLSTLGPKAFYKIDETLAWMQQDHLRSAASAPLNSAPLGLPSLEILDHP